MKFLKLFFFSLILSSSALTFASEDIILDDGDSLAPFFEEQNTYYQQIGLAPDFEPSVNAMLVSPHGKETAEWDLKLLKSAKNSIEISGSYCGGQLFRDVLKIIRERLVECPELRVHILSCEDLLEKEEIALLKELHENFADRFYCLITKRILSFPDLTIGNHVKMVLIDEKYFVTGGTNLDSYLSTEGTYPMPKNSKPNLLGPWLASGVRDMDVLGFGPLAKTMRLEFYKLFSLWENVEKHGSLPMKPSDSKCFNRYFPLTANELAVLDELDQHPKLVFDPRINLLINHPKASLNCITNEFIQKITKAEREIAVGNLYFVPPDELYDAFVDAAARNIRISLITNGTFDEAPRFNKCFIWGHRLNYLPVFLGKTFGMFDRSKANKSPLKNTRIFEYHVPDILYHKKIMVVDGQHTLIGSYNLGKKSHKGNFEMILSIDSKEIAEQVLEVFKIDLGYSKEVSRADLTEWYFNPVYVYMGSMQKKLHGYLNTPLSEEHYSIEDVLKGLGGNFEGMEGVTKTPPLFING